MDRTHNTEYVNLENVINISRGDKTKMLEYINQFKELIPERIEKLKHNLEKEDRKGVRQVLHNMSPQLQFFGVPSVALPIQRLEFEYQTIPMADLKMVVNDIIGILDKALEEVKKIKKIS